MADYGASDTSTTGLGANQFPISEVYVPNDALRALEGGPVSTDGAGKKTAPASMWVKDGNNVTLGAQADASAATDTGTFSAMSLVKRALTRLTSLVTNTNAFIDTGTTGTVTNLNDVVSMALPGGQATATVQILMGTLVGTLNFEVSPDSGTTWYAISGNAVGTSAFASTATAAGAWRFNVSGFTNFRVRLNPVTSGTSGTITIRLSNGVNNLAISNASALGQQVMNNSSSVAIASDQTNIPVKGGFTELGALSAGSLNADLVPSTDVSAYKMWSLHIGTNAYVGTLSLQCSNDNVNWIAVFAQRPDSLTTMVATTGSTNQMLFGPVTFRFLRVRMTSYTSGAAQGTLELYTSPTAASVLASAFTTQSGTWTVQPGNTANTTPWLTMPNGCSYGEIAAGAAGPSVIKASAGILYGILAITSAAGAPIAYDNASAASGNPIGALAANAAIGTMSQTPQVGVKAANGITLSGGATMPQMVVFYS